MSTNNISYFISHIFHIGSHHIDRIDLNVDDAEIAFFGTCLVEGKVENFAKALAALRADYHLHAIFTFEPSQRRGAGPVTRTVRPGSVASKARFRIAAVS